MVWAIIIGTVSNHIRHTICFILGPNKMLEIFQIPSIGENIKIVNFIMFIGANKFSYYMRTNITSTNRIHNILGGFESMHFR